MTDQQIKCSVEYPGIWLTLSGTLEPGEDVIGAFQKTKATLNLAYREMYPSASFSNLPSELVPYGPLPETQIQKDPKEQRIKNLLEGISECVSIPKPDGLESYRKGVEQEKDEGIWEIFNNKLQSLQNK